LEKAYFVIANKVKQSHFLCNSGNCRVAVLLATTHGAEISKKLKGKEQGWQKPALLFGIHQPLSQR